eukprot:8366933-Pyramimonas_sp.AAC.1
MRSASVSYAKHIGNVYGPWPRSSSSTCLAEIMIGRRWSDRSQPLFLILIGRLMGVVHPEALL